MKTITIGIGNSDDKLTQLEWSSFIQSINAIVEKNAHEVHFTGFSIPTAIWQNACWVFEVSDERVEKIKAEIHKVRRGFRQDAVAWIEGTTERI